MRACQNDRLMPKGKMKRFLWMGETYKIAFDYCDGNAATGTRPLPRGNPDTVMKSTGFPLAGPSRRNRAQRAGGMVD